MIEQFAAKGAEGRSYYADNVYVRHADRMDDETGTPARADGWLHFRKLAVVIPPPFWNRNWYERIYQDGSVLGNLLDDHAAVAEIPCDLVSRHGWREPFPSIETPGLVDIRDFGADEALADNSPAIQAAIDAHDTVLIPRGNFKVRQTIHFRPGTRLIGVHPFHSRLHGDEDTNAPFDQNPTPALPRPIIETADDAQATNMLAFLGVRAPNTLVQHGAHPVSCYPVHWRCGPHSVWNMVHYQSWNKTNWRFETVMSKEFGIGDVPTPWTLDGYVYQSLSSKNVILTEAFAGNPRLSTKSWDYIYRQNPNLSITKSDGGTFSITSLAVANALFTDDPTHRLVLTGTRADSSTLTASYDFAADGMPNPRAQLFPVNLGWDQLVRLDIVSTEPFAIDDIAFGSGLQTFAGQHTTGITVDKVDKRVGFFHFPYAARLHPQVLVTGHGGGKFYNFWYHGDVWGKQDYRHVLVDGAAGPLHIYHWHLQHIHSDSQALFRQSTGISVYGSKHEHSSRFLDIEDCDHIRIFGTGGLSDAAVDQAHYLFRNCANYLVSSLADEIHLNQQNVNIHSADNPLIQNDPQRYRGILDWSGEQVLTESVLNERPILWLKGQPEGRYAAPTPWVAWLCQHRLPDGLDPLVDPSGQGVPALLRYAFGLDAVEAPRTANPGETSGLPGFRTVGGQLRFHFLRRRNDAGLVYEFQQSPDLQFWQTGEGQPVVEPIDENWESVQWGLPQIPPQANFVRVVVRR